MSFYPLDDDDEVFKPKSKSPSSAQKSSFTKSSFDDDEPSVSRDDSIKVETRREEVETRSSDSRLADWRRDMDDRRVTYRWNKHTEETNNSQSSKPERSWVRISILLL